eukprot:878114_1
MMTSSGDFVDCPICGKRMLQYAINEHLDSDCTLLQSPRTAKRDVRFGSSEKTPRRVTQSKLDMAAPNKCSSQQSPTISNSRKRRLSSQSSSSLSRQTPSKLMRLDQGKLIVLDPVDLSNDDTNLSKCPESGPPVYDCTESEMPECDPPAYNSSESKSAEIISLEPNISGAPSHASHTVSSSSGEVISHQNGNNDRKTVSNQFPGLPGSISRPTLMSQGHPSSTVNNWPIPVQRNSSTGRNSAPKFFSSLSKSYFP